MDLMTPAELEAESGIKQGTQAALRSRRQLPFVRLGGGRIIRYQRAAIAAWIAAGVVAVGQ